MASVGTLCTRHPDRGAIGACDRCGDFICDRCGAFLKDQLLCEPCRRRTDKPPRPTDAAGTMGRWMLVLSTLMFVYGALLVFLGLVGLLGVAGLILQATHTASQGDSYGAGEIFAQALIGALAVLYQLGVGGLHIAAGRWVRRVERRRRIMTALWLNLLALAAPSCLYPALGMIIVGMIVMTNHKVKAAFAAAEGTPPTPAP